MKTKSTDKAWHFKISCAEAEFELKFPIEVVEIMLTKKTKFLKVNKGSITIEDLKEE